MLLFLCYVFPPLAVLFMGRPFSAVLNMVLTMFGWAPGVKHALVCYADRKGTKSVKQLTKAINHPEWTKPDEEQSEGRMRRKGQKGPLVVHYIDSPYVGMNGTQFRRKN